MSLSGQPSAHMLDLETLKDSASVAGIFPEPSGQKELQNKQNKIIITIFREIREFIVFRREEMML